MFLLYRSTHRIAPQAGGHVAAVQQQSDESALLGRADPAATSEESKKTNEQKTVVQREIETLSAERQTLAARIQEDKSTIASLTTQRQQLIVEIEQREKELVQLSTQREEAARAAADLAKVVEAQQRHLGEQRVVVETQQQELAMLQQAFE